MPMIDRETLSEIARHRAWPSLSFYLPTHRTGSEKEQDRIRLKNLRRDACERLVAEGLRGREAEAACAAVAALIEDPSFWREASDGLAIFSSDGFIRVLRLDLPVPEQSVVGDRFYLRPLFSALPGERRFLALTLDRNGCRLYRGDVSGIEELPLADVPQSLADELRYDEVQEAVQYSSVPAPSQTAGGGRPAGAIFHGHGGEKDTDKSNLERYLRKVEAAVTKAALEHAGVPIVVFGVEYALAMYRSLDTSHALADEQVPGATDELSGHEVHIRALAALEPRFNAEVEARIAALTEARKTGLVTSDPAVIVPAAASGRVEDLFLDDGVGPFGTFDRERFEVKAICADTPRLLRESRTPSGNGGAPECGWDLVDLAASEVILHGGRVHAFSGENAPLRGVVALLRY